MEKEQLPNSTLVLIFGILSIVGCCCYGVLGAIFGVMAIVIAKRAQQVYESNPELYTGYQNVKTGKILGIIGLVVSVLYIALIVVVLIIYGGIEGIQEMQEEILRESGAWQ
ncbi:CCC motif membrane protein [Autumnicola psychrophila]|uniref:CCC motif membrane protein n=1 Tax=Autumnicola psychrophila TaxID=3075592 RepID=A0ABU3DQ51_9FLAO|nr:CCC motif membrane protein [Zunongwangia sp. F225]MDT0685830.1 CCC motif membrane protein [Zunongwangia sp. F225]